jgi:hypothetical protein
MSEDEQRKFANDEQGDEVDAHGRPIRATDESGETEDDDFEAHRAATRERPGRG